MAKIYSNQNSTLAMLTWLKRLNIWRKKEDSNWKEISPSRYCVPCQSCSFVWDPICRGHDSFCWAMQWTAGFLQDTEHCGQLWESVLCHYKALFLVHGTLQVLSSYWQCLHRYRNPGSTGFEWLPPIGCIPSSCKVDGDRWWLQMVNFDFERVITGSWQP